MDGAHQCSGRAGNGSIALLQGPCAELYHHPLTQHPPICLQVLPHHSPATDQAPNTHQDQSGCHSLHTGNSAWPQPPSSCPETEDNMHDPALMVPGTRRWVPAQAWEVYVDSTFKGKSPAVSWVTPKALTPGTGHLTISQW